MIAGLLVSGVLLKAQNQVKQPVSHTGNTRCGEDRYKEFFPDAFIFPFPAFHAFRELSSEGTSLDSSVWVKLDGNGNAIRPLRRFQYAYDDAGYHVRSVQEVWFANEKVWEPYEENRFEYDEDGQLIMWHRNGWDLDLGVFISRYSYEYIYRANLLETITVFEHPGGGNPVLAGKIEFSYSVSGWNESQTYYVYYPGNDYWLGSRHWTFNYDVEGRLIKRIFQQIDSESNGWLNQEEIQYLYDANGDPVERMWYTWSSNPEIWVEKARAVAFFDPEYKWVSSNLPNGFMVSANRLLMENHYEFDLAQEDFTPSESVRYYYSTITNLYETVAESVALVYPNPVDNWLTLSLPVTSGTFSLLDGQGNRVLNQGVAKVDRLFIGHLIPGWYYWHLTTGGKEFHGKLLKLAPR